MQLRESTRFPCESMIALSVFGRVCDLARWGGSRTLQSEGLDGQQRYWDVESTKQILAPAEVKDALRQSLKDALRQSLEAGVHSMD